MAATSHPGGASTARTRACSGLPRTGTGLQPPRRRRDSGYLFALTSHFFVTVLPFWPLEVCGEYSAWSFDAWNP